MPQDRKQNPAKAEQILQGAMQEFLERGYVDTSMARVASTAGVSKETLYNYFENKEALFTAIVERLAQQHVQEVFDAEPLPDDPVEQLRLLAPKAFAPENLAPERMNFYRLIVAESGRFPHLAERYVQQFEQPNLAASTALLKACKNLGTSDPEAAAWMISGTLMFYYLMMELLHGKTVLDMTPDRLIEALIEVLFPQQTSL